MAHSIPLALVVTAFAFLWPCKAEDPTRNGVAVALRQIGSGCAALRDADPNHISQLLPEAVSSRRGGHSAAAVQLLVACQLLQQQKVGEWQLPVPTPSPVQTQTVDEVESLGGEVRRLLPQCCDCGQPRANETFDENDRLANIETEWLTLPDPRFPLVFLAIALAVLCPVILLWETCVIPKTTFFHKPKVKSEADLIRKLPTLDILRGGSQDDLEELEPLDMPWSTSDEQRFWKKVEDSCYQTEDVCNAQESTVGQVGFARFEYVVFEGNQVSVSLARYGSMRGTLEASLLTKDAFSSGYAAVAGKDYVAVNQRVCFADGEQFKEVLVEIPVTPDNWQPTRWFLVELTDVSEGSELVGPSTVFDQEFEKEGESTYARVFILQQETWPADLPAAQRWKWQGLWLVLYYIKERIRSRKGKYWKTLLSLLYVPFHDIVVTTIIQKLLIDWATHPDQDNFSGWVAMITLLQAVSTGILRMCDVVQRLDRGRTGGCRQEHRWQLLSKLLMMDFEDHFTVPDSKWFYAALVNVDVIVADGYWQFFMLITNIFGLILTLAMLIWSELISGSTITADKFIPFFAFAMVLPLSLYIISRRAALTKQALEERMDGEQAWVDTFAWITQSGARLYSMGPRELARLERSFTAESKLFVGRHQNARDIVADSVWVTRYMGYLLYTIFLAWAAIKLADGRKHVAAGADPGQHVGPGDFVVAIRIYAKFGKYLTLLIATTVKMLKASVSLERVAQLLNLPEHTSKFRKAQQDLAKKQDGTSDASGFIPDPAPDCDAKRGTVSLEHALFQPGHVEGLPMGRLDLSKSVLEFPLGKVIYVQGGSEPEQLTLLAMIAGILNPTQGSRICPENVQPAMLSSTPLGCPHTTVTEAFQLVGLSRRVAKRLAQALGIDPHHETERLGPAQMQAMALMRLLISNPELIVAVRPLSLMGRVHKKRMAHLLRAWQLGVMPRTMLSWLADIKDEEVVPVKRGPARTLVITGEEFFNAHSGEGEETPDQQGNSPLADVTVRLDTRELQVSNVAHSQSLDDWQESSRVTVTEAPETQHHLSAHQLKVSGTGDV